MSQNLSNTYPELFPDNCNVHIPPGWLHIVIEICEAMVKQKSYLEGRIELLNQIRSESSEDTHQKLEEEIRNTVHKIKHLKYPRFEYIKEKFGRLSISVTPTDTELNYKLDFAECLSSRICQYCGAPGIRRNVLGLLATVCEKHFEDLLEDRKENFK